MTVGFYCGIYFLIEDNAVAFRTASVKPAINTQNSQYTQATFPPKRLQVGNTHKYCKE